VHLRQQLADIRRVTEQNVERVTRTRGGTAELLAQAETLAGLFNPGAGNGRSR